MRWGDDGDLSTSRRSAPKARSKGPRSQVGTSRIIGAGFLISASRLTALSWCQTSGGYWPVSALAQVVGWRGAVVEGVVPCAGGGRCSCCESAGCGWRLRKRTIWTYTVSRHVGIVRARFFEYASLGIAVEVRPWSRSSSVTMSSYPVGQLVRSVYAPVVKNLTEPAPCICQAFFCQHARGDPSTGTVSSAPAAAHINWTFRPDHL